jgi:hypothetical protein
MNSSQYRPGRVGDGEKPSRKQRSAIVSGIMAFVLILVMLQLWLLTATMDAYLGGDLQAVIPAALASTACLLLNLGLLRFIFVLERK